MNPLTRAQGLSLAADLPELDFAVEATSKKVVTVYRWAQASDTGRHLIRVSAVDGDATDR